VKRWCIPERDRARFVAQMEDILDLYTAEHPEDEPLICMDEAAKQLTADVQGPIPVAPGRPAKQDYHYERRGVRAIFLFFDPIRGRRRLSARPRRTRVDWAEEVRRLLEEDYPQARKVKLVCDNLNTHAIASLYEAFEPELAHRLARRLEIHPTPRNGSWLNVAEIELSVLDAQYLDRRIGSDCELDAALAACQRDRNAEGSRVEWRFDTATARKRLRHLYPVQTKIE
jgi:DDE superfamily endonuclease